MTEKKKLTMRQELRDKAANDLREIKQEALEVLKFICEREKISRHELMKSISAVSHKAADYIIVTQLANRYEAEMIKLWNNQQKLDLEEKK